MGKYCIQKLWRIYRKLMSPGVFEMIKLNQAVRDPISGIHPPEPVDRRGSRGEDPNILRISRNFRENFSRRLFRKILPVVMNSFKNSGTSSEPKKRKRINLYARVKSKVIQVSCHSRLVRFMRSSHGWSLDIDYVKILEILEMCQVWIRICVLIRWKTFFEVQLSF